MTASKQHGWWGRLTGEGAARTWGIVASVATVIGVGAAVYFGLHDASGDSGAQHAAATVPTVPASGSVAPSSSAVAAGPTASPTTAAPVDDPNVLFSGRVTIRSNDIDLDINPPGYLFNNNDIGWSTNELVAISRARVALWSGSGTPTKEGCKTLIGSLSMAKTSAVPIRQPGAIVCVRTSGDNDPPRYASVTIDVLGLNEYEAAVMVWDSM